MTQYKTKVHVELVKCDDNIDHEPIKNNGGALSMTISEYNAMNIDMCEKLVLSKIYLTMRDAKSQHFSAMSKKSHSFV